MKDEVFIPVKLFKLLMVIIYEATFELIWLYQHQQVF